jgi:hypothetical protein
VNASRRHAQIPIALSRSVVNAARSASAARNICWRSIVGQRRDDADRIGPKAQPSVGEFDPREHVVETMFRLIAIQPARHPGARYAFETLETR